MNFGIKPLFRRVDALRGLPREDFSRAATISGRATPIFNPARRMALHDSQPCDPIDALF